MGGFYNGEYLNHVERYDCQTDTWEVIAPMNKARSSHTAIAMPSGYIYVFGGWMGHERYDITNNTWTHLSDLFSGKCGISPIPAPKYDKFYTFGG